MPTLVIVFLETIAVPFVCDQYGWDDAKAVESISIFISLGAIGMMFVFGLSGYLTKKIDERLVLLFGGVMIMTIGCVFFLPFGHDQIVRADCTETTTYIPHTTELTNAIEEIKIQELSKQSLNMSSPLSFYVHQINLKDIPEENMSTVPVTENSNISRVMLCTPGCPESQTWCEYTPQLTLSQFIIAGIFLMAGYPVALSVSVGMYSKILGARPQGLWMAFLSFVGSCGRVIGPVCVSYIYTNYGTYWTFGILTFLMLTLLLVEVLLYERLGKYVVKPDKNT